MDGCPLLCSSSVWIAPARTSCGSRQEPSWCSFGPKLSCDHGEIKYMSIHVPSRRYMSTKYENLPGGDSPERIVAKESWPKTALTNEVRLDFTPTGKGARDRSHSGS